MDYRQYIPSAELRRYVRYFWSFDCIQNAGTVFHIKSFADKYPRLIFQDLHGFESLKTLSNEKLPACYLSGIDTKHTDAIVQGNFSHFGVSFYPHGLAAFFGESPESLINTMPDIELICQCDVQDQLQHAADHFERVAIMSKYLHHKLQEQKQDLLIDHLLHEHGLDFEIPMHTLTKTYQVSQRSLQRRFKSAVGISHKKYQRILRFEESLKQLVNISYRELGAIAYELKFTDQSHFIKDFTEFSGMSPYAFVKRKSVGAESSSFIYTVD